MEKIYYESSDKSGHYAANSPCIRVKALRPARGDDEGMPAIIILETGKINGSGEPIYDHIDYIIDKWSYNGAIIIRKAIEEYDRLKASVFAEEGGSIECRL